MATLKVQDLMTAEVIAAREDDDLGYIYDLMFDRAIRHLPVIDEAGMVVGIISQRDLLQITLSSGENANVAELRAKLRDARASHVMTRHIVTVAPETPIAEAGKILIENKLGCLPVTEKGALFGILTESDFISHVVREERSLEVVQTSVPSPASSKQIDA